jgi:hypothetical protein
LSDLDLHIVISNSTSHFVHRFLFFLTDEIFSCTFNLKGISPLITCLVFLIDCPNRLTLSLLVMCISHDQVHKYHSTQYICLLLNLEYGVLMLQFECKLHLLQSITSHTLLTHQIQTPAYNHQTNGSQLNAIFPHFLNEVLNLKKMYIHCIQSCVMYIHTCDI